VAKPKQPPAPELFTKVQGLLFTEDLNKLKAQALAAGETNYWPRLRRIVHDAVRAAKKGILT
jgi:hypothetical protein